MTPGEYKNGGELLFINYHFAESPFGKVLVASTGKGICYMAFAEEENEALIDLRQNFARASFSQKTDLFQKNALQLFEKDWNNLNEVRLHVKGTPFQVKVWEALLKIPMGSLTTYASIAGKIENAAACRAVGSAIGSNPVAFLIPCHRVIKSTGVIGQYHWGTTRKQAMIGWEAARFNAVLETHL